MKSILMFLILISLTCGNLLADAEKEIKAEIKQVTVYTDRAQIIRESSADISSGTTTLRLTGLSPYIDAQSIQVKGFGDFIILSVNHQNNYLRNLKSVRTQIESLRLKVEDEKAAISVLKEKEAFLVANRAILVKETTFTLEQLKSVMDLYTNNMEQVTMATLKKNRLIGEYEKQIAALQQQIADRTGKAQLP